MAQTPLRPPRRTQGLLMIWSNAHEGRFYVVLAIGLVGLLFLAFRFASAPTARSKSLVTLRAAALSVLVLILLNPVRVEQVKRAGPAPTAVFLIDGSRSMSLEAPVSRARAVDDLIRRSDALLSADRKPRIEKYAFGRDILALSESETVMRSEADETRLSQALEQLPSRFGDTLPFGVFVFSDGRSTESDSLDAILPGYRALGVPIHVIPVGDARIAGDVAVQDIDAPREARKGTRVPVRVTLRSQGYAGQRTGISIRAAADPKGDPLATLPITLLDGEQAHELVVETDRAKGALTVQVNPLPHEAVAANNQVPFQITPRTGKLRVIYMEGTPSPEYRFIQDALEEDPDIKCVSMNVDNQYDAQPRLHRVDDPTLGFPTTREELLSYDVVICSDIARTAFTPEQLEWTVELVNKRGGGFVMVGGHTSFGSGAWDQTVWDGLIPVDMSGRGATRSEHYDGSFQVVIPPRVTEHPIWRIVDDPALNRQVLARMPMFHGTNLTDRLKPAATELGLSNGSLPGSGVVTVFSCQSFGRGRTFAMATDSTVAWGTDFEKSWGEGDNRHFRKFWRNVVRWLTENCDGGNRRLNVETDKIIYRPGQEIQVKARTYDETLVETDRYRVAARLRLSTDDEPQPFDAQAVNLVPQLQDKIYHGKLAAPDANETLENLGSTLHKQVLEVAAFDGEEVVARSNVELQVIDDPSEFRDPRPNPTLLTRIAQETRGNVIESAEELSSLLGRHQDASIQTILTRSPLWDTPLLWLLLLGLLSAEWIVRRMRGLA
jgi:uncharacterized membrane protein